MTEKLLELQNQLDKKPILEDWQNYYDNLKIEQKEFTNMLEYASEKSIAFEPLYRKLVGENASDLVDRLRNKGFFYKSKLGNSFQTMGYKILEQVRYGKKADTFHSIMRIFWSHKEILPDDLAEAFKPIYSEEMFKVFIFSFLSGIIGKSNQNENKN